MPIQIDGYKVSRNQKLEDLTTGLDTSLSALAKQVWVENPVSSVFRQNKLEGELFGPVQPGTKGAQFKGPQTPVLSKENADKKAKDAGVSLDIGELGMPEGALDLMIKRKREEIKRKALISAAPEGFWSGAAQIGTGLAVSLADPINVASAFIPIVGQARYAKLVANTSTTLGKTATRAGVGVAEGLVGAAIVEPLVLFAAESEQADYGLYDSFLNLTFGAVLGGGLHAGLGAVGDVIGKTSPQTKQDLLRASMGQVMDNKPVDVGYVAQLDPSFREQWRASEVEKVVKGVDADERIVKEFNRAMDELRPELITRAERLPDAQKAIEDLEAGRVPTAFIDDVSKIVKARIDDFEATSPKLDAMSPEASRVASIEAQNTLDNAIPDEPQDIVKAIDSDTDDILTALDEQQVDTKAVRKEIDDINTSVERESNGLRAAINCMLGK
ncbi:MAG: hypothetical protein V3U78_04610 [Thiotrichaceae bacterium]